MFALTQPLALAGLLALLIPLLIHLWERRHAPVVRVGSLRWLRESTDAQVSRFRFSEFWRFLLRALIVFLLVLLLAEPVWRRAGEEGQSKHWTLVDPSVNVRPELARLLDSLDQGGAEVRSLEPGFPPWAGDTEPAFSRSSPWALLRDLDRAPARPDSVTVFLDPRLARFSGERPALPFALRIVPLPADGLEPELVHAWAKEDSLQLLVAESGAEGVRFRRLALPARAGRSRPGGTFPEIDLQRLPHNGRLAWRVSWANAEGEGLWAGATPRRRVYLAADEGRSRQGRQLEGALAAVEAHLEFPIRVEQITPDPQRSFPAEGEGEGWLFWLSSLPLPAGVEEPFDRRVLLFPPTELAPMSRWWEERIEGRALRQSLFDEEEDRLPEVLMELLFGEAIGLPDSLDRRVLSADQIQTRYAPSREPGDGARASSGRALHFPLWLLLVLLFGLERALPR